MKCGPAVELLASGLTVPPGVLLCGGDASDALFFSKLLANLRRVASIIFVESESWFSTGHVTSMAL